MDFITGVFLVSMLTSYLKEKASTLKSKQINYINSLIDKYSKEKDIRIRQLNNEFQAIGLNFNKVMADYQNTVRGSSADKNRIKLEKKYVDDINTNLSEQKQLEDKYQDNLNKANTVIRDIENKNPYEYLADKGTSKIDRYVGTIGSNLTNKIG